MSAYYNENDPKTAAWLRELIKEGLIADGEVDTRSIVEVQPADLTGFAQCHFFAGIGGWSYALRLAGWPDDREVWTGSCPCQPFSSAGAQVGGDDPRHLWPAWFRLIRECRPDVLFGEQVEAAVAHGWLDLVCDDLEREGYAAGAVCLSAASVGAPHIRQRLWFVADAQCRAAERQRYPLGDTPRGPEGGRQERQRLWVDLRDGEPVEQLGDPDESGSQRRDRRELPERAGQRTPWATSNAGDMGHATSGRCQEPPERNRHTGQNPTDRDPCGPDADRSNAWTDILWLPCRDGKARPTQPRLQPLAHGVPARVGRLRGYGNAIVPQVAAEVIRAYMEIAA